MTIMSTAAEVQANLDTGGCEQVVASVELAVWQANAA